MCVVIADWNVESSYMILFGNECDQLGRIILSSGSVVQRPAFKRSTTLPKTYQQHLYDMLYLTLLVFKEFVGSQSSFIWILRSEG